MSDWLSRTKLIYNNDEINKLTNAHVAVFGLGGVGGYAVEALARAGIGKLTLIDHDIIDETNINRQILATTKTVGMAKVDVAKERCLDINPDLKVNTYNFFYMPETKEILDFSNFDYVIDAIDTITGKLAIIEEAKSNGIEIISSMGTGNKVDNTMFEISDIFSTEVCPLAKVMRKELRSRGIKDLKVVYSKEQPVISNDEIKKSSGRPAPGSTSFVPPVAGLIIAGEVIKDLTK